MAGKRKTGRPAGRPAGRKPVSKQDETVSGASTGDEAEANAEGRTQLRWSKVRNQALVAAIHENVVEASDGDVLPVAQVVADALGDDPAFADVADMVTPGRVSVHVRLLRRKLKDAGEYAKLVRKLGHELALGRTGGASVSVTADDLLEGIE